MSLRPFMLWSHRWLGLTSSLVLAIAGITGAILTWPLPPPYGDVILEFHMDLGLGRPGAWTVLVATAVSVLLQAGGIYLWWRTKRLALETGAGWRRFALDLHNVVGVLGLVVMFVLAVTALGRVGLRGIEAPGMQFTRKVVSRLHTAGDFPAPARAVYAVASLGFALQGVTGVAVWLKPRR
jgi:uncharacterized iron-regulated membrane protein